jgi:hypothetical protein
MGNRSSKGALEPVVQSGNAPRSKFEAREELFHLLDEQHSLERQFEEALKARSCLAG